LDGTQMTANDVCTIASATTSSHVDDDDNTVLMTTTTVPAMEMRGRLSWRERKRERCVYIPHRKLKKFPFH
jgi:hypothetical protein